jgi:hypothetical protein
MLRRSASRVSRRGPHYGDLTATLRATGRHPPSCQSAARECSTVDAAVCPMCARNIMPMIRMHTMHRESPATRAAPRQAQPSQREGQGFESP